MALTEKLIAQSDIKERAAYLGLGIY